MQTQAAINVKAVSLQNYVSIDEACAAVFPRLVDQLEIANSQLTEGVETLIKGFAYLSRSMNLIDPASLDKQLSSDIVGKIYKIQRFTQDLIQAGESIHETTVREATENRDPSSAQNIKRIIIRTLNMQTLATDVRKEADNIITELETAQDSLLMDQGAPSEEKTDLIKTFIEMQMEINKMIVAFQFQDRVTQIINAVINSIKDLTDYITEAGMHARNSGVDAFVDLNDMLKRVEQYYISKEQYELIAGAKGAHSDDIVLF